MDTNLGAIPLSADILVKANIGLWAFELDEGKAPRMYVDEAMLGLIGLTEQISPEETYHAWYDHIDEGSYGLVAESVEKMTAGEHAEVQYPWHHPNGETWMVRCGGVRNFDYTAGVRIEGTHQNVTSVVRFDEKELKRLKTQALEIEKSKLREEMLSYVSDQNPDADKFVDFISRRITEISGCDQVIFLDKNGNKSVYNTLGTETVPDSLCANCPFERCWGNEKYGDGGIIVMNDCQEGYMGEAVHPECPVKSSIIQQVFADDKLVGWLNVNYLKDYHTFSPNGIDTMKTVSAYFGLLLERINAKKAEEERTVRDLAEKEYRWEREITETLVSEYTSVYYVDLVTGEMQITKLREDVRSKFGDRFYQGIKFSDALNTWISSEIHNSDVEEIKAFASAEYIRSLLRTQNTFKKVYRVGTDDNFRYFEMKLVKVNPETEATAIVLGIADRDAEIRTQQQEEIKRQRNLEIIEILASEYSSVYYIDLTTDELNPYTMNAETESEFGQIFNSGITYSEAFRLYVEKLIYPEDQAMMLEAGSLENIRRELHSQKTFLTTYRSSDNKYSEMKFVKVGGEADEPVAVALGFAEKDEEIRAEKQRSIEQQRYNAVVKALSSEYSSIYFANVDENILMPYASSRRIAGKFGEEAFNGMSYTQAAEAYIQYACSPESQSELRKALSPEYIKDQLSEKQYFTFIYQNEKGEYCEMKCVHADDRTEAFNIVVGFAVKDKEIRALQEAEEERQRNTEIIEILASEYSSVYYIDLTTDGLNPYTMNEETETSFGSVFRGGITYSEAYKLYVDKLIFPEDKAMMLKAGSIENIRRELAGKKTFLTTYRSADNKYSEMKFVKVGGDYDEPVAVALGFAEKDEEIRQEQAAEAERQMNFDIIEILASEYTSVYYIDLTTDGLNPYTMNAETETTFGSVFRSGITYSEAYRLYVDKLIFSEDKPMMLKAGAIGNIMKELRTKKTFLTTYRNAEGHYSEMKFVKVGNEEGTPTAVALGFADKDAELRAKLEEERVLQRNIDIIEILASEYTSVYYIDMTTDELDPYTMNEQTETQFGEIFRSGIKYSDAFKLYVDKLVYPEDKAMMLKAGSVYNILNELAGKKTFLTQYRNAAGEYCEMKFVKVGDDENPESVALGFSNKDEEIRDELARKEKQAMDQAVISGLSDDFGCVVYTSFDEFDEVHYRFDPLFEKHIDGWSKINDFKVRLERLTNTIMHPEDRDAFWAATRPAVVREAIDKDGVYYVNFRTLIDGEETYYQAKFVRDEIHPETNVIAGFHNVDAETKREMEALEQAKAASRAKTDFLFNMSHDIRTPMNAIIGFTSMAMRDADNPERVRENLKKVQLSGNMLLSLINDILDMSRIESGKATLNEVSADMEAVFTNIQPVMANLAASKDIALSFEFRNIRDRFVYADTARVDRIMINLVSNAVKYTEGNGRVEVLCEQLKGAMPGFGLYRFTVKDNGIGMSEEFQKQMFEEFAREENSTISGIQGTGLGLPLAKKLAEMMSGRITCESRQGVGSTFFVTVPFRLQTEEDIAAESSQEQHAEAVDFNGKKVLLVEDNELNREIALDILENEGILVETAVNGEEAVRAVSEKGTDYYDFVLMDIQMPVMNGYEATTKIRKLYPDAVLPIIALSANAFEEDRQKSIAAGMNDHVAKPIKVDELKSVMAKFL